MYNLQFWKKKKKNKQTKFVRFSVTLSPFPLQQGSFKLQKASIISFKAALTPIFSNANALQDLY